MQWWKCSLSPSAHSSSAFLPQSKMVLPRRIQFEGDDAAYIHFLEARVSELEGLLHCQSRREAHPQTHRPPINREFSQTKRLRQHSDEAGNQAAGLRVIQHYPNHKSSAPRKEACRGETRLRWQSSLDRFLAKIPDLGTWKSRDHESLAKTRRVLRILVQGDTSFQESSKVLSSSELITIIPILHQYRDFTMNTCYEGDFHRKLACFRELVFMSLCAVALEMVENAGSVYDVMRSYSGSKAQEKHLKKLVRGAIWANRSISALSKSDWGPECSEVVFVGEDLNFFSRVRELIAESWAADFFICTICRVFGEHVVSFGGDGKENWN